MAGSQPERSHYQEVQHFPAFLHLLRRKHEYRRIDRISETKRQIHAVERWFHRRPE